MKINGNAIKPGNVIQHDGGLWVAVKTAHVKPGKGGAFATVELKNLINYSKRFRIHFQLSGDARRKVHHDNISQANKPSKDLKPFRLRVVKRHALLVAVDAQEPK